MERGPMSSPVGRVRYPRMVSPSDAVNVTGSILASVVVGERGAVVEQKPSLRAGTDRVRSKPWVLRHG